MDIKEILAGIDTSTKIETLKTRSFTLPDWSTELLKDYEPKFHAIVEDRKGRKDKIHSDGSVDKAARLAIGLERLLVERMAEFTFAIPVKRVYSLAENEMQKAIIKALEAIYKHAHIDTVNQERGTAYYAACELFTLWYVVQKPNNLYGFPSKFKLKCRTFSPMGGCKLYPLFDETGDLLAMSFEYERKVKDETTTFFETFTEDSHYKWQQAGKGEWEQVGEVEPISLMKIPGAYICRPRPIFDGLQGLREDLEYTISRNSDIVAYNASPILKIVGNLKGEEQKGETRRVYRLMDGGDVSYVSWAQSVTALENHVTTLLKYFWMQAQMPDISFDALKNLGNIGYDARRMLLSDAHLKVGKEAGPWLEFFNRECNVIKAFLKKMNVRWGDEVDNVQVEHIITPFIIEDEQAQLDYHMKANGNKPVESQRESIMRIGKSADVEQTLKEIVEQGASTTEEEKEEQPKTEEQEPQQQEPTEDENPDNNIH